MTIKVKWFSAADAIGIAQPQFVFDLFELMTGNDDFILTTNSETAIVLAGDTRLAGLDVSLQLSIDGRGLTYSPTTELTGGTLDGFTVSQKLDDGSFVKMLELSNWNADGAAVNAAVDLDDGNFGGDNRALDDILYGDGWNYVGSRGVDIIDPGQSFTFDGINVQTTGNDVFRLKGGDDLINASDGNDKVYGGAGKDNIQGGLGRDKLFGGKGADTLTGDLGYFEGASDLIKGGGGDDTIYGAARKDTLIGGRGNDRLDGGQGNDVFVFSGNSGHDFLSTFHVDGKETLDIRTKKQITVDFFILEDELETGPWKGEYFDRGYLVEWGNNSIYVNTYASVDELGISDYILI